jgi:hypothetical protein
MNDDYETGSCITMKLLLCHSLHRSEQYSKQRLCALKIIATLSNCQIIKLKNDVSYSNF